MELMGVCRASETEVECWNENGGPNAELTESFKTSFMTDNYRSIPIKYGQKTRVAFFKFTNPPYNDPRGTIDSHFQGNVNSFELSRNNQGFSSDEERTEYRGAILITKLTDITGKVSTTLRKNAPPSGRMAVKEGAELTYLGTKFTIRKILRAAADPSYMNIQGGSRWAVAMTAETSETILRQLVWIAIGHDGLVIRAVDKDGNPAIVDPNTLNAPNFLPGRPIPAVPKYFNAQIGGTAGYGPRQGDDYPVYTNINPAKIKQIYAYGMLTERIEITDIPLDPRK